MDGYIKLSRKFFVNPLWTEPREYSKAEAWIDLIQSAKFEAQSIILNGRVIEVQRGEVVASRRYLELRWKWSNTKVDNFLKLLSEQGMITKRNANQNTILTLTKFNTYNDANATENANETPEKRQRNATGTPNIKKDKKVKKENNTPPIPPDGGGGVCDELSFDRVWDLYDKKIGDKEKLRRKWEKLKKEDKQAIVAYIPQYKTSQPNKQYRKNFDTFLNNCSWNDEIITQDNDKPHPPIADTKHIGSSEKRSSTI